jgi:hypothetical protein
MKRLKINCSYRAKTPFSIGYYAMVAFAILLILGYWLEAIGVRFILHNMPELRSHVSNFAIGLVGFNGLGYAWLLFGKKFRHIALLGLAMAAANVLCETVMGFMNTTDIIDALYGIVGLAISFAYLIALYKFGLVRAEKSEEKHVRFNEKQTQ